VLKAHQERSGDLFVRATGGRELGDPLLGLGEPVRAWTAAGDPRQLGAGLTGPGSRRGLLEDRDSLLQPKGRPDLRPANLPSRPHPDNGTAGGSTTSIAHGMIFR
jgi:hypothetical protein